MTDKLKAIAIIAGFLGFLIGMMLGAFMTYKILNARLYTEMRSADSAIWIRIDAVEGEKGDFMNRIDRLARVIDQYDLAVAQVLVYEKRQEIMNVRISKDD